MLRHCCARGRMPRTSTKALSFAPLVKAAPPWMGTTRTCDRGRWTVPRKEASLTGILTQHEQQCEPKHLHHVRYEEPNRPPQNHRERMDSVLTSKPREKASTGQSQRERVDSCYINPTDSCNAHRQQRPPERLQEDQKKTKGMTRHKTRQRGGSFTPPPNQQHRAST